MSKATIFYVYVDRTLEEVPRVFYVGKGKIGRTRDFKRNKRWTNISNKYGFVREIILGTKDERFALDLEIFLIREYKTFSAAWEDGSGWGANFTSGGEGTSGRIVTKETRAKLSISSSGENNPMFGKSGILAPNFGKKLSEEAKQVLRDINTGKVMSEESIEKMRIASTGKKHTEESKKKISDFNTGKVMSVESRAKIGLAHKGKTISQESIDKANKTKKENPTILSDSARKKMSDSHKGENNSSAILNDSDVLNIRAQYLTETIGRLDLAKQYKVSRSSIRGIVTNKTWKHLLLSDENKTGDLAYMSNRGENSHMAKLTPMKVLEIREKFSTGKYSHSQLAIEYKITRSNVGYIVTNKSWKYLLPIINEDKSC